MRISPTWFDHLVLSLVAAAVWPLTAVSQSTPGAAAGQQAFNGRNGQLEVAIPRFESPVEIDGFLQEPVWRSAALLTGFSTYQPVDGRPSPDSTEILLWYSRDAIHVGVRAFEPHGTVRATLADRDRVRGDDYVELHFDTFLERKRAFVFVVNPLGVQADGTKAEGGSWVPGGAFPGETDLNPDFQWQSKGRLTEWGYEVEVRIPFSSFRYPERGPWRWGFNAVRFIQHSGFETTWSGARRGSASFIAQAGTLSGISSIRRGRVLELNPEARSHSRGATMDEQWRYDTRHELGGNVRWGVTSNFTLNGTIRPDFSQIEADEIQIAQDPRFALFYPEKRPFFVDAIEQFNTPNSIVYTRRIIEPLGAAKLTGRLGRNDLAFLSALDDDNHTTPGDSRALFNILRLRRDIGRQSTAGLIVTDREEGESYNRVLGADTRIVFGGLYFAQLQAVASTTRDEGFVRTGPLWEAMLDRTGRNWGFNYRVTGVSDEFEARSGFVPRRGFVNPFFLNRLTWYGKQGMLVENFTAFITAEGTWLYDEFFRGNSVLEGRFGVNNNIRLRGGWNVNVQPRLGGIAFDPRAYAGRWVLDPSDPSSAEPFLVNNRQRLGLVSIGVTTPQFVRFSGAASMTTGRDIDFVETRTARRTDAEARLTWRPTDRARVQGSYRSSRLTRIADDALTAEARIPRLSAEYQIARPVFLRFVGQYESITRGEAVDWRTGRPLGRGAPDGPIEVMQRSQQNALRADWLFSYRPNPGTVFFVGYGSSMVERDPLAFRGLRRVGDGFFVKGSYLFRL
jgi:hypothetical protein